VTIQQNALAWIQEVEPHLVAVAVVMVVVVVVVVVAVAAVVAVVAAEAQVLFAQAQTGGSWDLLHHMKQKQILFLTPRPRYMSTSNRSLRLNMFAS